jgi:hypothetical protein
MNSTHGLIQVVLSVCSLLFFCQFPSSTFVSSRMTALCHNPEDVWNSASVGVMVHRHPVQGLSPLPPATDVISLNSWNLLCEWHIMSSQLLQHSPLANSVTAKMAGTFFFRCIILTGSKARTHARMHLSVGRCLLSVRALWQLSDDCTTEFGFAALSYFCVVQMTNAQRRGDGSGGGGECVARLNTQLNEVGCEGQFWILL